MIDNIISYTGNKKENAFTQQVHIRREERSYTSLTNPMATTDVLMHHHHLILYHASYTEDDGDDMAMKQVSDCTANINILGVPIEVSTCRGVCWLLPSSPPLCTWPWLVRHGSQSWSCRSLPTLSEAHLWVLPPAYPSPARVNRKLILETW